MRVQALGDRCGRLAFLGSFSALGEAIEDAAF
jgi:hypothetical protein